MAEVTAEQKELARLNTGIRSAYAMLELYGVPELRAKSVANGITVLVSRMDKEAHFQAHEIAKLRSQIAELKKYFTSGNSVPVERATILAKDFWQIIEQQPE